MILENPDGWVREVLVIGNPKDMRDLEARYLVVLDAAKNPMSYNRTNGNKNFHTIGVPASEALIRRLREDNPVRRPGVIEKLRQAGLKRDISHLRKEIYKEKISLARKKSWAEGKYEGVGFKSGEQNISKLPEVKIKLSEKRRSREVQPMTGKKHSGETKMKMAEARRLYWERKRSQDAGKNYTV